MTDVELLRDAIKESGYRLKFIAEQLDLSYQGFLNKLSGQSQFNSAEITILMNLLKLDMDQVQHIFLNSM